MLSSRVGGRHHCGTFRIGSGLVLIAGRHVALPWGLGRLFIVQPQIGLSAGGPSTLGSLRIEMRIRGCSCRHASRPGGRKSTPVDRIPTSSDFSAVRFNSVMNTWSTPVNLYSTRRKVCALPVDPPTVESGFPGRRSLTLLREWPISPV